MTKAKATKLDKEIQEGLYDPKSYANEMSKKIMKTPLKTLEKWEDDFNYEVFEGLSPQAKTKLYLAWGYPLGSKVRSPKERKAYDPKKAEHIKCAYCGKDMGRMAYEGQEHWDYFCSKRHALAAEKKYDLKQVSGGFEVKIPYSKRFLIAVKSMKGSRWNPDSKSWFVPSEWEGELTILMRDLGYGREKRSTRYYDPKTLSLPPTRWYAAMVKGIRRSSDVRNPYAIVKNIWLKLSPSKKAEIKAREKKGERFKYNLPLPVDKPTRGTGTVRTVKPFNLGEVQVNVSIKDYLALLKSGMFNKMKRQTGEIALVKRCKSDAGNVNLFIDKG